MRRWYAWLLLAGAVAGIWYWVSSTHREAPPVFRLATVERGELVATIAATGTIEPEEVVDVGAQVAGKIDHLGVDPNDSTKTIDYGSQVEEGTVLAQIDDAIYRTQVAQARANLARSIADLGQLEARQRQRQRDWQRIKELSDRSVVAESERDAAEAELAVATSAVAVGQASIEQSRAAVEQAETNLGYTTIRSPVNGAIVDRRVNVGQTVVASLNAPSLFLIAKDLRKLQVWVAVNEADIGQIHPSQRVTFTVDAFPDDVFQGEVAQIRLNATMTQNVVTYTVVISTDNSSGTLIPYLTANVQFEVGRRADVLHVPNAALRWQPKAELIAPEHREAASRSQGPAAHKSGAKRDSELVAPAKMGRVWVASGRYVQSVAVEVGLTDASSTEIKSDALSMGDQVVFGVVQAAAEETRNPFAPQMRPSGPPRQP